jgi:hypothetical protein
METQRDQQSPHLLVSPHHQQRSHRVRYQTQPRSLRHKRTTTPRKHKIKMATPSKTRQTGMGTLVKRTTPTFPRNVRHQTPNTTRHMERRTTPKIHMVCTSQLSIRNPGQQDHCHPTHPKNSTPQQPQRKPRILPKAEISQPNGNKNKAPPSSLTSLYIKDPT